MIEVDVETDAWLRDVPDVLDRARLAAEAALAATGANPQSEISVLLADDAEVAELNQRFRKKAGPTNVLSFPAPAFAKPHLGDVILAYETCAREAREQSKTLCDHTSHLVAHGVLHLLGWDHMTDAEADAMEALERTVLAGLGIADPYAAQDETDGERRRPD